MAKTGITLYSISTPNGWKISIALEELGLPYTVEVLEMSKGTEPGGCKSPEFLKVNPNGRIPAIIDHDNGDLAVWESGSILIYLADKYGKGKVIPTDDKGRSDTISWVMWQMSGQGPMQGQAGFFTNYFPTKQPATVERFVTETNRLYSVLETQLSKHKYVAGDTYTIADMAIIGWALATPMAGIDLHQYPHVYKWLQEMRARPAVIKGWATPDPPAMMLPMREKITAAWEDPAKHKALIEEVHAKQLLTE